MTLDEYNGFCASLPAATHVVQWGGAMSGKSAARFLPSPAGTMARLSLSPSNAPTSLSTSCGSSRDCRPAPYLASRGMKWIQRQTDDSMDDEALQDYVSESHRLVALKLPRLVRKEIGLQPR